MTKPVLYRKRLIPDECICLKDDEILHFSENDHILVTKWHALKPKKDLHHGYSAYFWDRGFKLSKFYRENGDLLYWYCDIIHADYPCDPPADPSAACSTSPLFMATDLLADVIIYPDGFVKVVDLDELAVAFEKGALTSELLKAALTRLNDLLNLIYSGEIQKYKQFLEQYEN